LQEIPEAEQEKFLRMSGNGREKKKQSGIEAAKQEEGYTYKGR
jgi:hypothetical protein